jgi:hypothetical protein
VQTTPQEIEALLGTDASMLFLSSFSIFNVYHIPKGKDFEVSRSIKIYWRLSSPLTAQ